MPNVGWEEGVGGGGQLDDIISLSNCFFLNGCGSAIYQFHQQNKDTTLANLLVPNSC